MRPRDYHPARGQAFQGDIVIMPIPDHIAVSQVDEIAPTGGRLIIQKGELFGHHHAVQLPRRHFRSNAFPAGVPPLAARTLSRRAGGGDRRTEVGYARLFRDPAVPREMVRQGLLTRTDLAIGCLVVECSPAIVSHEEHGFGEALWVELIDQLGIGAMPGETSHEVIAASYGISPQIYREAVRS